MNRKSFIIHKDSLDILDDLTNEQAGELFKAIKAHQLNDDFTMSALVKIAFSPFKNQFARDDEKYRKTCESRAVAGSKGGKQKVANASKRKQEVANLADSVSKSKNDSDSKKDNKRKVFKKPTVTEVQEYISEKLFSVDAEQFINHYDSNGWKVGKNSMKDWKAAVRTWQKRESNETNTRYDNRSSAKKVSDKLDEIARRDIEQNGFTHSLDN